MRVVTFSKNKSRLQTSLRLGMQHMDNEAKLCAACVGFFPKCLV